MKTSNKLIVALVLTLLIIPLGVIAYIVKTKYVPASEYSYLNRQDGSSEPLNAKTPGRFAIPISQKFNKVSILNGKQISISLHLTNSETAGIKIPNYAKESITYKVENGVLNIILKDDFNATRFVDIVVYAPIFKSINLNEVRLLELTAKSDSLQVNLNKTESFSFGGMITTRNNKGEITKVINQSDIKNLVINLNDSKFSSFSNSYQNIEINTKGKSEIELNSGEDNNEVYTIKNLKINTLDSAKIDIKNINIDKFSGKISDNTIIQMPAANLKQFFKN
ncbi:GIN domain-containing protein [Pedobacter mucosus]|uniref:GIN domain-containing protein n=1 Tax=Pedobacter mucosus TaxID=2895286 RepID=UPI001EE47F76|nr:DUF2807 domain-containing protein [Pedobacter mucosus]UKT63755.1 DUF2807 domain-containing protein [Pedobacter mucosus]